MVQRSSGNTLVFACGIFLGAFLLFHLQPLVARHILPVFGSTPAVWTTCMLFFQTLLVGGYAYAHLLTGRASSPWQIRVHTLVLAATVASLLAQWTAWGAPMLPSGNWRTYPPDAPGRWLLLLLLIGAGLPYFVLSATNPLLQKWFAMVQPGTSPYRLYVLSNLGSLAGLLAYPFVVERLLPLRGQAVAVAALFVVYAVVCIACARRVRNAVPPPAAEGEETARPAHASAPPLALWLLLPFCGSVMLLAVTNQLCQEVAVVPLLWVVPLALYLVSFMIGFSERTLYVRPLFTCLFVGSSFAACFALLVGLRMAMTMQIVIYAALLFSACTICHGELARLKPPAQRLTSYYLIMSVGGALGGLFVGLAAPVLFKGFWEFHCGLALCWILLLVVLLRDRASALHGGSIAAAAALIVGVVAAAAWFAAPSFLPGARAIAGGQARLFYYSAALLIGVLVFRLALRRPVSSRFHAGRRGWARTAFVTALFVVELTLAHHIARYGQNTVRITRNFFGPLRVREEMFTGPGTNRPFRSLLHGNILHGMQPLDPARARETTAYYTEQSGAGLAILGHPRRGDPEGLRLGVVGLGVGTIAAYTRMNDALRFYEINPDVAALSRGPEPLFTYIRDASGRVDITIGDGRLTLERQLRTDGPAQFDVLVLDAFSSDAIPVHLLTREAFDLYLRHLRRPGGIIAVNIANRFINLMPVLRANARHHGLHMILVLHDSDDERELKTRWALLSPDAEILRAAPFAAAAAPLAPDGCEMTWTDDFGNIFALMF